MSPLKKGDGDHFYRQLKIKGTGTFFSAVRFFPVFTAIIFWSDPEVDLARQNLEPLSAAEKRDF
jgi:hypothetical protein